MNAANDLYDKLKDIREEYDLYEDHRPRYDALTQAMEIVRRFGGNWDSIVADYESKIGTMWIDNQGDEFRFAGLLHGDDDYYYVMWSASETRLLSCVGGLESWMTQSES